MPMKKADIEQFYARLAAANPAPATELEYASPFQLLIAVILSAQATDVGVNKATAKLFPVAPTPEAMLALGEDGLIEYIKTIGLFRTKAKNVIATCRILVAQHGGQVPEDRAALEALPGDPSDAEIAASVGPGAAAEVAAGAAEPAVDVSLLAADMRTEMETEGATVGGLARLLGDAWDWILRGADRLGAGSG